LLQAQPDFGMSFEEWQEWVRVEEDGVPLLGDRGNERFWLLAEDGGTLTGAVIGRLYPEHGLIRHLLLRDPHDLGPDMPAYVERALGAVGADLIGALDLVHARL
jgi:hypothetical protein